MKIRTDFVTNSSSSSFIIGIKGDLTKDRLLEVFKVDSSSPLYSFTERLTETIIDKSKDKWSKFSIQELIDDYDGIENLPKSYKNILDKGMDLYRISADSDGDYAEAILYYMSLDDYNSNDLIIWSD